MTEQEMRDVFREMREEQVPADSLARVRMGVEQRAGKRRWWRFAVPVLVAGCIVAGFLFLRPVRTPEKTPEPVPIEVAQVQPPPEAPVRTAAKPGPVRRRPAEAVPSMLIRIETPDPDVVILLVN